jgi:hypothetical protein
MAAVVYNVGKTRIAAGDIALDTGDLRMALITGTKTGASNPDLATMAAIDAVSGVGFHTERITLASLSVTQDDTNDRANVDAGNPAFAASAGVTALAAVIYDNAGAGADSGRFPILFDDTNFGAGIPLDGGLNVTISDWLRLV